MNPSTKPDPHGHRGGFKCFKVTREEHGIVAGCYVLNTYKPDTWIVNELYVSRHRRGLGLGSQILRSVTDWADHNRLKLVLEADPFGAVPGLSLEELRAFYGRHGFSYDEGWQLLLRHPAGQEVTQ